MGRVSRSCSAIVAVAVLGGCENGRYILPAPNAPAPVTVELTVAPSSLSLVVGESARIAGLVTGSGNEAVSWTSSAPAIASVTDAGVVTCLAVGNALITGVAAADSRARGTVAVTCAEGPVPPQQPGTLIELGGGNVAFTHAIGRSPCPQEAGEFRVRNATSGPLTIEISSRHRAIDVRLSEFTLEPGQTATVTVFFNCAVRSSFQTTIDVRASGAAGQDVKAVRVNATIQ